MRDHEKDAFHLLLNRYDGAVLDRHNQRREFNETHAALCDVRRRNDEYEHLVADLIKALKAAKVKKMPPLPRWYVDIQAAKRRDRDDDIPF